MSKNTKSTAPVMFSLIAMFAVICISAMTVVQSWTRHGDEVRFLSPSEWGFGMYDWDGVGGTCGRFYEYGFFERTTHLHPHRRP